MNKHDVTPNGTTLYFLPFSMRVPLKFGHETVKDGVCARVKLTVCGANGKTAEGWGETPLSVPWVWPSSMGYFERQQILEKFCIELARVWAGCNLSGHPIEVGHAFQESTP